MSVAIPRYLLPGLEVPCKRNPRLLSSALRYRGFLCRNATTGKASSKPPLLEKPAKFYPPSHPQRLTKRALPRQYPGPPLSQAQREEQKVKKYPHMMPAEGTFMFWFLNSRMLHMGICLVIIHLSPRKRIRFVLFTNFLLTPLFSSPYSFPSPSSSLLKTSTAPLLSPTNYHRGTISGLTHSNSSARTGRSTRCTRITSAPRRPNGERRESTTCKSEAVIGKLMAWRKSKGWAVGLRRLMRTLWVLPFLRGICRETTLRPRQLLINRPMSILMESDGQSKDGLVSGNDTVAPASGLVTSNISHQWSSGSTVR